MKQLLLFFLLPLGLYGQRPYGHEEAIAADDPRIGAWASSCQILRGWQHCADTSFGFASVGDSSAAIGPALANGVVSLGDGGMAIVHFAHPLFDAPGPDFAVFENGFRFANDSTFYFEYAFVEVSSDGVHFVRFPSLYLGDTLIQKDFNYGNHPKHSHNLAGNYVTGFGTPFDLVELSDSAGIDLTSITHIRIIDAIGSLDSLYIRRDNAGHRINDPWPTPFASSGFDLDAVAFLHAWNPVSELAGHTFSVSPNPLASGGVLRFGDAFQEAVRIQIIAISGQKLVEETIEAGQPFFNIPRLHDGIYQLVIIHPQTIITTKLIIR